MYKRIQSEVISTTRFDENSDLSTTYLCRINTTRANKIKGEEEFPVLEQAYMIGKLLHGTECQILLETGGNQVIHAQITLLMMQTFTFVTKVCI